MNDSDTLEMLIVCKTFADVFVFQVSFCFLMSDRNLSSTKQSNRQTMRKCPGLIDSLVRYLKDSVEAGKPDNKVGGWVADSCTGSHEGCEYASVNPAELSRHTLMGK